MTTERSLFSDVPTQEPVPTVSVKHAALGEDVPVTETMLAEVYQSLSDLSSRIRQECGNPGTNTDQMVAERQEWINLLKLYERLDDTLDTQASRRRGSL